jgi:hypothetical protein
MKILFGQIADSTINTFEYKVECNIQTAGFLITNSREVSICSELQSECLISNFGVKLDSSSNVPPNKRILKFKTSFKKGDTIYGTFLGSPPELLYCSCVLVEEKDLKNGFDITKNRERFKPNS